MDIASIGTQLLMQKLGLSSSNTSAVTSALSGLLGGDSKGGGIDLGSIVSSMQGNGNLLGMVTSFLGDGDNDTMKASDVSSMFDGDKLSSFASQLGIDTDTAAKGLSDVIPSLIDGSSKGGSLLDSVGGVGGLLGGLKKFL